MRSTFYLRWHIKFASPFLPKGRSTALVIFLHASCKVSRIVLI